MVLKINASAKRELRREEKLFFFASIFRKISANLRKISANFAQIGANFRKLLFFGQPLGTLAGSRGLRGRRKPGFLKKIAKIGAKLAQIRRVNCKVKFYFLVIYFHGICNGITSH